MSYIVDNVHLPDEIEHGAEIGLLFSTGILISPSGIETPNQNWSFAKHQGTFNYGVMDNDDIMIIKNFQAGRRGMARGFLFSNPQDNVMARAQIGTGDGVDINYPIVKTYPDTVNPYFHVITRPIISTLQVWVNNVLLLTSDYAFMPTSGLTFDVAPGVGHAIEAACSFDLAMRFTNDYMPFNVIYAGAVSVPAFGMIEILEYIQ